MVLKWDKFGNRCLSVKFDKLSLYNLFRCKDNGSKKGINSYYEKNFWIFGFKFTYINVEYDNIVCVKLSSGKKYSRMKNSHEINIIKETLINWVKENTYSEQYPPFNWNYLIKKSGEIVFFITGEKNWFINNGLEDLVTGIREIVFNEDEYKYFPKYNPNETNKVICW